MSTVATRPSEDDQYLSLLPQKYEFDSAGFEQKKTQYLAIQLSSIDDENVYDLAKQAKADVVKTRTTIEKKRKELKEFSLKVGRKIDDEAKRLTALVTPIETHLSQICKEYEAEEERKRLEPLLKEQARIKARVDRLHQIGALVVDGTYILGNQVLEHQEMVLYSEEEFNQQCQIMEKEAERLREMKAQVAVPKAAEVNTTVPAEADDRKRLAQYFSNLKSVASPALKDQHYAQLLAEFETEFRCIITGYDYWLSNAIK